MRARRTQETKLGFVARGPGFHVWEETRAEALHAAAELSRGARMRPPSVVPRRPTRRPRAR